MTTLYVSAYTIATPYEQEAAALRDTLVAHRLEHVIVPYCAGENWHENVAHKPRVILSALLFWPGPVVWMDADARVQGVPALFHDDGFRQAVDVAGYWMRDGKELVTATLFFSGSSASVAVVERWAAEMQPMLSGKSFRWEQPVLQDILRDTPTIRQCKLSQEYCRITQYRLENDRPTLILQTQAARRYRQAADRRFTPAGG